MHTQQKHYFLINWNSDWNAVLENINFEPYTAFHSQNGCRRVIERTFVAGYIYIYALNNTGKMFKLLKQLNKTASAV
jgi:hypothetical protein